MSRNFLCMILVCIILLSACGIRKYSTKMEQLSTTEISNINYSEKQVAEDIDFFIKSEKK